jgi:hypothetical protein
MVNFKNGGVMWSNNDWQSQCGSVQKRFGDGDFNYLNARKS